MEPSFIEISGSADPRNAWAHTGQGCRLTRTRAEFSAKPVDDAKAPLSLRPSKGPGPAGWNVVAMKPLDGSRGLIGPRGPFSFALGAALTLRQAQGEGRCKRHCASVPHAELVEA